MRIDPHVHFRDEEQSYKETIEHGLALAKEQGVNYVFDMPNTAIPILRKKDVERRLLLVPKQSKNRYFLYIGSTKNEKQLKEAISLVNNIKNVIGIKMYAGKSTGNLAIIKEKEQEKVYQVLTNNNYIGVLAVHCEKESCLKNIFDYNNPYTHGLARPKIAEIESIKDQIKFVKKTKFPGTLHICHVSCQESVLLIDKARKDIKITCGVAPHHLMFDDQMLKNPNGALYKINPPLRSKKDVKNLRECLKQGKINWIETDHAPHTIGEKMSSQPPSGYPSLYLYKELIENFLPKLGINEKQIIDLTFNNIIKTFNLHNLKN